MSEQAGMSGELIYEHAVQISQVTEYGVAFDGLLSGAAAPPCRGARFDYTLRVNLRCRVLLGEPDPLGGHCDS